MVTRQCGAIKRKFDTSCREIWKIVRTGLMKKTQLLNAIRPTSRHSEDLGTHELVHTEPKWQRSVPQSPH
jgi:hypothetical protein